MVTITCSRPIAPFVPETRCFGISISNSCGIDYCGTGEPLSRFWQATARRQRWICGFVVCLGRLVTASQNDDMDYSSQGLATATATHCRISTAASCLPVDSGNWICGPPPRCETQSLSVFQLPTNDLICCCKIFNEFSIQSLGQKVEGRGWLYFRIHVSRLLAVCALCW